MEKNRSLRNILDDLNDLHATRVHDECTVEEGLESLKTLIGRFKQAVSPEFFAAEFADKQRFHSDPDAAFDTTVGLVRTAIWAKMEGVTQKPARRGVFAWLGM